MVDGRAGILGLKESAGKLRVARREASPPGRQDSGIRPGLQSDDDVVGIARSD